MKNISKKTIFILALVFGLIAVVLILFWTLFALSSVSVEFSSTLSNLTVSAEEIVSAGSFGYGSCVLFDGKTNYIQNIYNYAAENGNFAYIRVTNIETVFPNKYVIHVAEREELYAVQTSGGYLICDRDFRVLRTSATAETSYGQALVLSGLSFSNENVKIGDFLNVEQSGMLNFYSAMLKNNCDLSEITGKYASLSLSSYSDEVTQIEYDKLTLTTNSGKIYEIWNLDFALANKVALMFAVETSLYSYSADGDGNLLTSSGDKIYVTQSESRELISASEGDTGAFCLTYTILASCTVKIDNLTLGPNISRTESDIYYALVLV